MKCLFCFHQAHPYFYTSKTQSLLEGDGRLNAQSAPEPDEQSSDDGDEQSSDDGELSIGQIVGMAIGSAGAIAVVVVVVVGIGVAVWARKRHRASLNNETVPLVMRQ